MSAVLWPARTDPGAAALAPGAWLKVASRKGNTREVMDASGVLNGVLYTVDSMFSTALG